MQHKGQGRERYDRGPKSRLPSAAGQLGAQRMADQADRCCPVKALAFHRGAGHLPPIASSSMVLCFDAAVPADPSAPLRLLCSLRRFWYMS